MHWQPTVGPWSVTVATLCLIVGGWTLTSVYSQDPGQDDEKRLRQLEHQLLLLERAAEGMGPNHPRLNDTQKQISELIEEQERIENRQAGWSEIGEDRQANRRLIERLSDEELRLLVLKLSTTVKQLERRVERLERL